MSALISIEELTERFGSLKSFDLRWSLSDPGHGLEAYRRGHIPGAVFVDLDTDLAQSDGDGRHPLPPISEFVATLGRLGIERHDEVVVYDDMAGAVAARMWWMLESVGHVGARLLDGGLVAWSEAGYPLQTGEMTAKATTYPRVHGYTGVVRYDQLEGRPLADVRAVERYLGEFEPIDPKAGHIPGAVSYPFALHLSDGRFLDAATLAEMYRDFPENGVVSCGSGVNACHAALAMVLAGRSMPDVYIGSFSDWSRRDLPVNTGPNP